jgi:hypothetical protein
MPVSFAKMDQMNVMFALFVLLVVVLCVNPSMVKNLNQSVLGRLIIVAIIVYFSVHNTTAGILAALVIICVMQSYVYQEGFDGTGASASDNVPTTSAAGLEKDSQIDQSKVEELKKKIAEATSTPDQLATQAQMQPVASSPATPPMGDNGDDVAPSVKETFQTLGYSAY